MKYIPIYNGSNLFYSTGFKELLFILLILSQISCTKKLSPQPSVNTLSKAEPVNSKATKEARALLQYIYSLSGKSTLSGQHNYIGQLSRYSDEVNSITGKYPAIWGSDFGFAGASHDPDNIAYRQKLVEEAKKHHAAESIITLMWHSCRPQDPEPCGWKESVQAELTAQEWEDLITPGTAMHTAWVQKVDVIAGYLKQLQAANIPVIWRPYHEMNGGWFWWGQKPGERGYPALYRMLYDRLVKHHALNNLLWVWNTDRPRAGIEQYYPGPEYVDILAADIYENDYNQEYYNRFVQLANGKPIALGEVGELPTPQILQQQPQWSWFMVWSGFLLRKKTPDDIKTVYELPTVINRNNLPEELGKKE
ncbi:MAG: glycosyl hydrolase [Adhaeribacter sp.]